MISYEWFNPVWFKGFCPIFVVFQFLLGYYTIDIMFVLLIVLFARLGSAWKTVPRHKDSDEIFGDRQEVNQDMFASPVEGWPGHPVISSVTFSLWPTTTGRRSCKHSSHGILCTSGRTNSETYCKTFG